MESDQTPKTTKRWCKFCKAEVKAGRYVPIPAGASSIVFCDDTCKELWDEERIKKDREDVREKNYKDKRHENEK